MFEPFDTQPARRGCRELIAELEQTRALPLEDGSLLSLDPLYAPYSGQMFGILVCRDQEGKEVSLKAFSGQLLGHHLLPGWVPPVYDVNQFEQIMGPYEKAIKEYSKIIGQTEDPDRIQQARQRRKELSIRCLSELYDLYLIRCIDSSSVRMKEIFHPGNPPTGSGDCCTIKLLYHAFLNGLQPVSLAEFFYGGSTDQMSHGKFFPPCQERCRPILKWMLGLDIIYRDQHLVVVNKPAGLLSVPGRGPDKQDCIEARVKRLYPNCITQPAVHRLDMDTSGLLVLALDRQTHRELSKQFMNGEVSKQYVALLDGLVKEEAGTIELAFRLDPEHRPRQIHDPINGKIGITSWERIDVERGREGRLVTRIRFTPLTGRTHQLRVHSAHPLGLGTSILGDRLYGTRIVDQRMALHACRICFTHPVTDEKLSFSSEPDF